MRLLPSQLLDQAFVELEHANAFLRQRVEELEAKNSELLTELIHALDGSSAKTLKLALAGAL